MWVRVWSAMTCGPAPIRRLGKWFTMCAVLNGPLFAARCESAPARDQEFVVPQQDDWVDCGVILQEGADGEWDRVLWGGFALSVVKRSGTYFLYYQGSRNYDEDAGTVAWRSIGVATSGDGIRFTKYERNPVLTWTPRQNLEEGATSSAALVDASQRIVLYYGANTWAGADQVNADVRVALSDDGLRFNDAGVVLAHSDRSVWGFGDELFPLIAIRNGGERVVYYTPNGTAQRGLLAVARGDTARFSKSSPVADGGRSVRVWGPGGAARIGAQTYALFLSDERASAGGSMQVRSMTWNRPDRVTQTLATYDWADVSVGTVLLDEENQRWLLYYRNAAHDAYGVKVAPLQKRMDPQSMVIASVERWLRPAHSQCLRATA